MTHFLPPEWAEQSGVMLTWPHRESYWADTLDAIDAVFVETALQVSLRQKLLITCLDKNHELHIRTLLKKVGVDMHQVKTQVMRADDIWVRDHGPITVFKDQQPLLLDFTFTGWGYKYPAENDNKLTRHLHAQQAFGHTPIKTIEMALEGGGIEVDGHGTLLVTESCILSKKRNPTLTAEEIVQCLKDSFGVTRILWLKEGGLEGDDTDGHIDTLARFVNPHTICYVACDDESDSHYAPLKAMEKELQDFHDFQGQPYHLIPLPWPKARYADFDGRRLPVTYANFLIINDAVLMPTYDDPADEEALITLSECFPDRQIVAIPSMPVVQWYGSLHCMTMQLPSGVL